MPKCLGVDPVDLMCRYLVGEEDLSQDEKEILMFALFCESKQLPGSIVQLAMKRVSGI